VNHLSGYIPSTLFPVVQINMLEGNLFACDFNSNLLPENDPRAKQYSCGSDIVNASLYFWICFECPAPLD
jgi:hypothetical protein